MLKAVVEFSLRFRGVVIALAAAIAGYGLFVAAHTRLDVFPEFAPPLVVVTTEAPGLSPPEVEALVTVPVENAVNGVPGLESIRSQSIQGVSVVTAVFQPTTDLFRARQMVSERLNEAASRLPVGVGAPTMAPLTSSTSVILAIGLTSTSRSPMDVRSFADWVMRPRLLGVPGVAKVAIFGGEVRQLQIQVDPNRLVSYGLALEDVLTAARNATGVRGAGFVENRNQRIVLRTEGQALTPEALGQVVLVHHQGTSVRLKDVARIAEAPAPRLGDAAIMGKAGVVLMVSSQYGANTMRVTQAVEAALGDLGPALEVEQLTLHPALFRPANFIATATDNVRASLLQGAVLVSLVLFLFLFNVRTAFISLMAIPLSLLVAIIGLDRLGLSLNTLTLGGLAIAIGAVVDDAIIDVENIFRRLREGGAGATGAARFQVVRDASIEVRSAIVYATFVVALVFLPILAMSGVQGRLFAPLAVAYILAILASLVVALTLIPALSFALLPSNLVSEAEPPVLRVLKRHYRAVLSAISARRRLVLAGVVGLCLAAVAMLPFFGGSFLPELREGHFIVHMSAVPGTSIEESLRLGGAVTRELLRNPHIRSVAQLVGRAEKSDDTWGTHYSEFNVDLKPLSGDEAERVPEEIREALAKFPAVSFAIKPFLTERIEETLSGVTAQVAIKLFGDDLQMLDRKAREVGRVLAGTRGAADVTVEAQPTVPEITIRVRPERLTQLGLEPVQVLEAVEAAYQGTVVAQTYQGTRVTDVTVILAPEGRDPETIGALMLRNAEGARFPLRELTDIEATTGRYAVIHDDTRRRVLVTCNVRGRDVESFVAEARRQIASEVVMPAGVYPVFSGAAEAQAVARREILLYSLLAGVGIVLLLAVVFHRWQNLLLVLANLPFALVGGVLAVLLTGGWLSVGSLVGFVTLFGISTRNSIMLISHYDHLVTQEAMTWGPEAALRGAAERFAPIVMTALVTAFGLLPLAIGSGAPGREIEGPMATVILGGLVTSTLLNLLVLPTLALRYGRFEKSTVPS
jgi:CzcA family heavy metal efflux pump